MIPLALFLPRVDPLPDGAIAIKAGTRLSSSLPPLFPPLASAAALSALRLSRPGRAGGGSKTSPTGRRGGTTGDSPVAVSSVGWGLLCGSDPPARPLSPRVRLLPSPLPSPALPPSVFPLSIRRLAESAPVSLATAMWLSRARKRCSCTRRRAGEASRSCRLTLRGSVDGAAREQHTEFAQAPGQTRRLDRARPRSVGAGAAPSPRAPRGFAPGRLRDPSSGGGRVPQGRRPAGLSPEAPRHSDGPRL